ncbi:inositol monophosphatase family protein [Pullulanibacillus camelliae]|nr:inositol monophosphatase family protein [Pullulanibacillus camelliae]
MTDTVNWKNIHDHVVEWVLEAGESLKRAVKGHLNVESKSSPDDLVTNMDKQTEQFFINKVRTSYPGHQIVSEEGFGDEVKSTKGILWFIDPIDGTMNFVHQKRHFAISVGIYEEGVGKVAVIYDVISGDIYHCIAGHGAYINDEKLDELDSGELKTSVVAINGTWLSKNRRIDPEIVRGIAEHTRGTRSYGSAAIELAYVAYGILDGYLSMRLAPWDFGAGLILIDEVGGKATQVDGQPLQLLEQNSILIGKKGVHAEMLRYVQEGIQGGKYVQQK